MGRPVGTRNQDYDATRRKLAVAMRRAIVEAGGSPSLQELARASDVSIPTLKHYFGDRSGAVAEALRSVREDATEHIDRLTDPGRKGLSGSLTQVALDLAAAWEPAGVGRLFAAGLSAGLFDAAAGPGYLDGVLEPTVRAVERRLAVHAARGEASLAPDDELGLRTASLAFLSPLLVALLHQHALSGVTCRPLDLKRFIELHVERFVTAYGPEKS